MSENEKPPEDKGDHEDNGGGGGEDEVLVSFQWSSRNDDVQPIQDYHPNDQNPNCPLQKLDHQHDIGGSRSEKPSPLGLKLTASPWFLSMLESRMSTDRHMDPAISDGHKPKRSRTDRSGSSSTCNKLKASNFPMTCIVIGQWQRQSRHEGNLIAKMYYAKKKIVWEILEGALKSKIEILWSEIIGLKATMEDDNPAMLEIELDRPPLFFQESNPQPRKHTVWHQSHDFTGGQASCLRMHRATFPPGVLNRHLEKLLQCDERLSGLSRERFPTKRSLYFKPAAATGYTLLPPPQLGWGYSDPVLLTLANNPPVRAAAVNINSSSSASGNVQRLWEQEVYHYPFTGQPPDSRGCCGSIQEAINAASLTDIARHLLGEGEEVVCSFQQPTLHCQTVTAPAPPQFEEPFMQLPMAERVMATPTAGNPVGGDPFRGVEDDLEIIKRFMN